VVIVAFQYYIDLSLIWPPTALWTSWFLSQAFKSYLVGLTFRSCRLIYLSLYSYKLILQTLSSSLMFSLLLLTSYIQFIPCCFLVSLILKNIAQIPEAIHYYSTGIYFMIQIMTIHSEQSGSWQILPILQASSSELTTWDWINYLCMTGLQYTT